MISDDELRGFLAGHNAIRREFAMLARVAEQNLPPRRARLVENQIAMVSEVLHHHHESEDTALWPLLRSRSSSAGPILDALEAEHRALDPLLEQVTDRHQTLTERRSALHELHRALAEHLAHEEQQALPLVRTALTSEEWAAFGESARRTVPWRRLPLVAGWHLHHLPAGDRDAVLQHAPTVLRLLIQRWWLPHYQRRARLLYDGMAPFS